MNLRTAGTRQTQALLGVAIGFSKFLYSFNPELEVLTWRRCSKRSALGLVENANSDDPADGFGAEEIVTAVPTIPPLLTTWDAEHYLRL